MVIRLELWRFPWVTAARLVQCVKDMRVGYNNNGNLERTVPRAHNITPTEIVPIH